MKVSIRKADETSGFISKTTEFCLFLKVELAADEKDALKKLGIENSILMEYSYKGTELNFNVKDLIYRSDKGSESRFVAGNAIERNEMEKTIKESLTALKSHIQAQQSGGSGAESFEL